MSTIISRRVRRALLCSLVLVFCSASFAGVGRTPGTFDVTSTGAGTYAIDVAVPPGTNRLAPRVALVYTSRSDNGILGMGWDIAGLSVIARCAKTIAQDNEVRAVLLDSQDAFCLDGNRLRPTVESTYQTEVETFSLITASGTAGNGPASFEVKRKDGLIAEYGNSSDSRIEVLGSSTPRVWALSKIRDRSGNYIEFVYYEDTTNGSYRPFEIRYTGNALKGETPKHKLVFVYEARPGSEDPLIEYFAGGKIKELNRLNRIEVQHDSALVWKYQFAYESIGSPPRSLLDSVQRCATVSDCLEPTVFDYQDGAAGWASSDSAVSGLTLSSIAYAMPGDANGDGFEDLFFFDTSIAKWSVVWGGSSGFGSVTSTGYGSATYQFQALPIDLDSDGKRDLLVPNGANWWWLRLDSTGTWQFSDTGAPADGASGSAWVVDVDGDSREDVVWGWNSRQIRWRKNTSSGGSGSLDSTYTTAWTGGQFEFFNTNPFGTTAKTFRQISRAADFNGDTRADLLVSIKYDSCEGEPPDVEPGEPNPCPIWQYYNLVLYGTATGFTTGDQINVAPPFEVNVADFNADGLSDLYWYQGSAWRIRFSTGTSFLPEHNTTRPSNYQETVSTDWNSDGRTDLLSRNTSTNNWDVLRSTGETLLAATNTGTPATGSAASPKMADIDGDGLADLVYSGAASTVRFRAHNATRPDLLDLARDGFGVEVNFDYAPLTDSTVHTKLSGSNFPTREYQGSLHVVKQYTASTGVASPTTYTMSYSYEGARVHAQGRGLLGFSKRKMTDNRNGLFVEETFSQNFAEYAWIGMPTSVVVKQSAAGNVIRQTTNTLAKHIYESGTTERRFPYVSQSVVNDHEIESPYNGTHVRTATTTTAIASGDYGSPTSVSTTVTEVATGLSSNATHTETTSVTLLAPDLGNWCVGRADVTQFVNSHSHPWGGSSTRTLDYEWEATKCRVTKEIIEPASSQWKVTTELDFDDDPGDGAGFGNLVSIKVTPVGEAQRQTLFGWTADGRFLQTTSNPLSQVASNTWIASLGLIDTITDPNGLVLNYDYDGYGRKTRELRPDGTATRWSFGACTSPSYCGESVLRSYVQEDIRDTADAILSDRYVYRDMFEREKYGQTRTLNGGLSVVHSNYDSLGRLSTRSLPYISGSGDPYKLVTYTYDLLNRLKKEEREVSEADPSLQSTQWTYAGLSITETDALSRSTTKKFTSIGQVAQVIDSGGNDTDYEFDAFGNLLKTRDVSGNEVSMGYNVRGFKLNQSDPDMGSWTYDYYPLGELKTQTDAKSPPQVVEFTYDKLSRPLTRIEPEGTTYFYWGESAASKNIGQLEQVTSPGSYSETFWFDSVGRPIQTSIVADGGTYQLNQSYNASTGFLETLTYPTSTSGVRFKLKYAYQNGHLKTVHDYTGDVQTTKFWEAISTNARGMVFDEEFGNGLKTYSTHDHITGLLMDRETGPGGGSAVQNLNYGYYRDGSLYWRADQNQSISEGFYYDSLGRLDYTTGVSSLDLSYYAIGNISNKNDIGTYSYDATKKHAVTAAGSQSFGFDANGNMTPRNGATIAWTSYNLPSVINQSGGNSSTFLYGAHRQRYKQVSVEGSTTTTTIYVGRLLERVTVGAVTDWKHYVETSTGEVAAHIRSSTGANSTYYLLKDHLGSTDRVTNAAGSVVVALSYDAFGKRRGSNWTGGPTSGDWANIAAITRRGFTGHEHLDNLTLIHMNGRVYDPAIARFLSADPTIPGALFSQSFDRFGYVWNNPGTFIDPSGFSPDELYDFDSPDGGRRRDCDAFCRAVDRMLREFVASTRENRRAWPSYLFLEPEPAPPYPADLCSWTNTCPTGMYNPVDASTIRTTGEMRAVRNPYLTIGPTQLVGRLVLDTVGDAIGAVRHRFGGLPCNPFTGMCMTPGQAQDTLFASTASAPLLGAGKLLSLPARAITAGGGARITNIADADALRIVNAANRTNTEISVVGSRARGTPGPNSDWDYILPPGTPSRIQHSLSSSLPSGPRGLGEPRNIDFLTGPVDPTLPYITFPPGL